MQEFDEVYRLYFDRVYRFLLGLSGNHHIADELTQETFFRAMQRLNTYTEQGHLHTRLCTSAKNLWLNECRKRKFEAALDTDLPDTSPALEESLAEKERRRALRRAILELPEDYRDVVLLHIYAELPLKEIAFQKEKSESWGKVTFYRAKQLLNRRLEGLK